MPDITLINRRQFLKSLTVAAATPAYADDRQDEAVGFGRLSADPGQILDLPKGFEYQVIATRGDEMDDGLLVPGAADGMAAFEGQDGRVNLICNHEMHPAWARFGPFGPDLERLGNIDRRKIYDPGGGRTPGIGGTTTIVYDPAARRVDRHFLSLAGTEVNCAGGPTPWGSWLSCEESFTDPGTGFEMARVVRRERRHGYVFEVPAAATGPVDPVPLKAMGRFEHEAAAVDPATGAVYLSEDRHRSLWYRFLPDVPGKLAEGGRLQALAVRDRPGFDTRNWGAADSLRPGEWLDADWLDLGDGDVDTNDLRFRGREAGAAIFARGEGLCYAGGDIVLTATIGGPERLGQVFVYRPGSDEFGLLAESSADSLLRHADNITMSPWGDLIVCEDTASHCGLVGIRADGQQYRLADNAYSSSELAGVCFSPDGSTLFVNIQLRGLTLAINGPWPHRAS